MGGSQAIQHSVVCCHDIGDSWKLPHLRQYFLQPGNLSGFVFFFFFFAQSLWLGQIERQQVIRTEAGILVQQMSECLHQQRRANQQDERQRHLHAHPLEGHSASFVPRVGLAPSHTRRRIRESFPGRTTTASRPSILRLSALCRSARPPEKGVDRPWPTRSLPRHRTMPAGSSLPAPAGEAATTTHPARPARPFRGAFPNRAQGTSSSNSRKRSTARKSPPPTKPGSSAARPPLGCREAFRPTV